MCDPLCAKCRTVGKTGPERIEHCRAGSGVVQVRYGDFWLELRFAKLANGFKILDPIPDLSNALGAKAREGHPQDV